MAEDAPGWARPQSAANDDNDSDGDGPCCWKCRGMGTKGNQKAPQECPVCNGCGRLKPKRKQVDGALKPGIITRARRRPHGWHPSGPTPFALTSETSKWTKYVETANTGQDVEIQECEKDTPPSWIPRNMESNSVIWLGLGAYCRE